MLENLKKVVIDVSKKAQNDGLCKHKAGNFSLRDKETGYIVITPSGVDRDDLTVDDICVVDIDANVIEVVNKDRKPTSEILMHLQAYKSKETLHAIAHTHSKFATVFAVLGKEIKPVIYEVGCYGGKVPIAKYGRPGTITLAENIIEPLKISDVFLLEKHGVFCGDANSLEEALLKAMYIEEVAEIYYRCIMLNKGEEPEYIAQDELDKWKYPSQVRF